jgi:hypothetical protein
MSLDKCIRGRSFLQILRVERQRCCDPLTFSFDLDWLATLEKTHSLLSTQTSPVSLPPSLQPPTKAEVNLLRDRLLLLNKGDLLIQNIPPLTDIPKSLRHEGNTQTDFLLKVLQKDHIWTIPFSP